MNVVLVEVSAHTGSGTVDLYFSTAPYTPSDSVNEYDDVIRSTPFIEKAFDQSISVGSVSILNDGGYDYLLAYAFEGWPIRIYTVDDAADRTTATLVFSGRMGPIKAPNPSEIELTILDPNSILDAPVQTTLLSDGKPAPVTLGKVFNVTPVLTDAATHRYKVHDGAVTSVTTRAGGLDIAHTGDYTNGEFTLNAAPTGDVTCDVVQADATPAAMITELAARAGVTYDGVTINTAEHGIYIDKQMSVLDAIQRIAGSLGGVVRVDEFADVGVYVLVNPEGTPVVELTEDDVLEGSFQVLTFEEPVARVRLGYARNWTQQTSVLGAVTADNRTRYADPYLIVSSDNDVTQQFPLASYPEVVDSLFWSQSDAQIECNRRASLRNVKRGVYGLTVFTTTVLKVGDLIQLTHPRYGFASGQLAIVVRVRNKPGLDRQEIEIWR